MINKWDIHTKEKGHMLVLVKNFIPEFAAHTSMICVALQKSAKIVGIWKPFLSILLQTKVYI